MKLESMQQDGLSIASSSSRTHKMCQDVDKSCDTTEYAGRCFEALCLACMKSYRLDNVLGCCSGVVELAAQCASTAVAEKAAQKLRTPETCSFHKHWSCMHIRFDLRFNANESWKQYTIVASCCHEHGKPKLPQTAWRCEAIWRNGTHFFLFAKYYWSAVYCSEFLVFGNILGPNAPQTPTAQQQLREAVKVPAPTEEQLVSYVARGIQ